MKALRETAVFRAEPSARGVRITCKVAGCTPKSRVVRRKEWDGYLSTLNESTFNAACVVDVGVGLFERGGAK